MNSLQEQAGAMLATIDASEPGRRSGRLKPEDRALILRLAAKGTVTQAEIARIVGCDPATVSRTLRLLDTRQEARTILESGAARLAQTVVDTDDAAIALKTLGKLDVVRESDGRGDVRVALIVGSPEAPIPAEPRPVLISGGGA